MKQPVNSGPSMTSGIGTRGTHEKDPCRGQTAEVLFPFGHRKVCEKRSKVKATPSMRLSLAAKPNDLFDLTVTKGEPLTFSTSTLLTIYLIKQHQR